MNLKMHTRQDKKVTMREVAQLSGVSMQSVSRILNGKTANHNTHTIQKVTRVADELGYFHRQNLFGVTASIGIVVDYVADPSYTAFCNGVNEELLARGYLPIMLAPTKQQPSVALVEMLMKWRVDGIILRPDMQSNLSLIKLVNRHRMPLVTVHDSLPEIISCDHIGVNVSGSVSDGAENSRESAMNTMGWQAANLLISRVETGREMLANRLMLIDL